MHLLLKKIGRADLLIASIVLANDMLVTSHESGIRLIAAGAGTNVTRMGDEETWTHLQREYGHEH